MDKNTFIQAVDDTIKLKMETADKYVKETIEKIGDIGSPEKLIKKPYEDWTPEDLQRLAGVYGPGDDTPLARLIFNREYEKVKQLEAAEA
jgi:hypothetical protein